jgi:hypothetical protein
MPASPRQVAKGDDADAPSLRTVRRGDRANAIGAAGLDLSDHKIMTIRTQVGSRSRDPAVARCGSRAAFSSSDLLRGVFRRRAQESSPPVALLDDVDRVRVAEWCQMAVDRLQAGPRETSWLTATIMVQMTLGYAANARSRVPPLAYALMTRTG